MPRGVSLLTASGLIVSASLALPAAGAATGASATAKPAAGHDDS